MRQKNQKNTPRQNRKPRPRNHPPSRPSQLGRDDGLAILRQAGSGLGFAFGSGVGMAALPCERSPDKNSGYFARSMVRIGVPLCPVSNYS